MHLRIFTAYTANGDIVVLIVILTLPKIIICLTIRPSSRPFLTISLQFVGKISQISLRYSLTINIIIKSDQNTGNDLHDLIYINSYLHRTQKFVYDLLLKSNLLQ